MPFPAARFHVRSILLLLLLAAAILATVATAPPAAHAASTVRQSTKSYAVHGSTAPAIRRSINQRRKGGYDASAEWTIQWRYWPHVVDGTCTAKTWKITTQIKYLYPRWRVPKSAPTALKRKWTHYMRRLRVHELGHGANGRLTAARVNHTLHTAKAANCAALDSALHRTMKRQFERGYAADRTYDRRTGHGRTQGAVFP